MFQYPFFNAVNILWFLNGIEKEEITDAVKSGVLSAVLPDRITIAPHLRLRSGNDGGTSV
ncbi:hypothetical protein [Methylobacter sp.]